MFVCDLVHHPIALRQSGGFLQNPDCIPVQRSSAQPRRPIAIGAPVPLLLSHQRGIGLAPRKAIPRPTGRKMFGRSTTNYNAHPHFMGTAVRWSTRPTHTHGWTPHHHTPHPGGHYAAALRRTVRRRIKRWRALPPRRGAGGASTTPLSDDHLRRSLRISGTRWRWKGRRRRSGSWSSSGPGRGPDRLAPFLCLFLLFFFLWPERGRRLGNPSLTGGFCGCADGC